LSAAATSAANTAAPTGRWNRVDLVAAADVNPGALEAYGKELEIPHLYGNYHQMLEQERLDILSICTWPQTHLTIIGDAVRHPLKAIYCEKPLCMSLGEADDIVALTRAAGIPDDRRAPAALR